LCNQNLGQTKHENYDPKPAHDFLLGRLAGMAIGISSPATMWAPLFFTENRFSIETQASKPDRKVVNILEIPKRGIRPR